MVSVKAGNGWRARLAALLAVALVFGATGGPFGVTKLESPLLEDREASSEPALVLLTPPSVGPGQSFTVEGVGFPPGRVFQIYVFFGNGASLSLGESQVDDDGRLASVSSDIPTFIRSGSFQVVAQNVEGSQRYSATGHVISGIPSVSLSTGVGNAGETVTFNANGFAPGEQVLAYFNSLTGEPFATFKADEWGNVVEAAASMPYGPTGENTVILVGEQSKAFSTASFIVVGFFPTIALSTYAPRGDEAVGFSGTGFGPNEQVRVHLNNVTSPPVKTLQSDASGAFEEPYGFDVPFEMKGKQTFVFIGESSGAVVPADFEVIEYSPSIEPSTWSGRPGTIVTFYGSGFARNELVRVNRAAGRLKPAEEVSCFRTDENGGVGGLGSYIIQPTDEVGQLDLELVTEKSLLTLPLSIQILPAIGEIPEGVIPPNRGCSEFGE